MRLQHPQDLRSGDGADLSDTVRVTKDHTDLRDNRANMTHENENEDKSAAAVLTGGHINKKR